MRPSKPAGRAAGVRNESIGVVAEPPFPDAGVKTLSNTPCWSVIGASLVNLKYLIMNTFLIYTPGSMEFSPCFSPCGREFRGSSGSGETEVRRGGGVGR